MLAALLLLLKSLSVSQWVYAAASAFGSCAARSASAAAAVAVVALIRTEKERVIIENKLLNLLIPKSDQNKIIEMGLA